MQNDERITWVRAAPNRKFVQTIVPSPDGWSVTTEYIEAGEVKRRDVEVAIRRGTASVGAVAGFVRRLFGGSKP